jgi:hypothetical protein
VPIQHLDLPLPGSAPVQDLALLDLEVSGA